MVVVVGGVEVVVAVVPRSPVLYAFCVEAHESFRGSFHRFHGSFHGSS